MSHDPPTRSPRGIAALPVFGYGFRPFFLGCGIFAAVIVPMWLAIHALQYTPWPGIAPQLWHAHEMLFGFCAAALGGFLLTAVPSWTGARGFAGGPLVAVFMLWLSARILLGLSGSLAWPLVMAVELAFFPAILWLIAPPILRERNRNMALLAIIAVLWITDVVFLVAISQQDLLLASRSLNTALDLLLLLVTLIGGRIVPSFTANALRRSGQAVEVRKYTVVERLLPLTMIGNVIAGILGAGATTIAIIAAAAALLHLVRQSGWRTFDTRGESILWILHLAYLWLPVGFALKFASLYFDWAPGQFWQHAFGIGAIATMILAVMTRASLGHTGRPLVVSRAIVWAYVLLASAGISRVFLPHWLAHFQPYFPGLEYADTLLVAGALWTAAFTIFSVCYAPILWRRRLDGKAG